MKIRKQMKHPPDRLYSSTTMLILGQPGSGKTTFASTVGRLKPDDPCPLLMIDPDNGSAGQKYANDPLIPESFADYKYLLGAIKKALQASDSPPYQMNVLGQDFRFSGVIIDTINRCQDIIRRDIKGGYLSNKRLQRNDYGTLLDDLLGLLLELKEVSETKPFHLVITAQVAPIKVTIDDPRKNSEESPEHYIWGPSVVGKIGPKLSELFDTVITTYYDPVKNTHLGFAQNTVTPLGIFTGKLRFGQYCKPPNPATIPVTWVDFLRLHGVNVNDPESIGQLDTPQVVDAHWAEVEDNRRYMEGQLKSKGIPLETMFAACNNAEGTTDAGARFHISTWEDMRFFQGSGKDAISKAHDLHVNGQKEEVF